MGKNILRGVGYVICALLFVMGVLLVIASSAFGSDKAVEVFGFNIYIASTSEFDAVPEGSAVVAKRCNAYELEKNNLVLYRRDESAALGYLDNSVMNDGIYTITVSDSSGSYSFEETDLIGKADFCSPVLGAIIRFSLTPFGILVMAILPCLALVVFDVIRAAVSKLPPPEVIPQIKNGSDDEPAPASGISVNENGGASYSRSAGGKSPATADSVLFSYTAKQRPAKRKPDIIPLNKPIVPPEKQVSDTSREKGGYSAAPRRSAAAMKLSPKAETSSSGAPAVTGVPASVAARNYLDNAIRPNQAEHEPQSIPTGARPQMPVMDAEKLNKASDPVPRSRPTVTRPSAGQDTAELPELPRRQRGDAFFAQSEAPQLGRTPITPEQKEKRSIIELEDALSSNRAAAGRSKESYSGKRSSVILSQKDMNELITDDDDSLDRSRYEVDDILAGLEKRKRK